MRLGFSSAEETFRTEAAAWLERELSGAFRDLRGVRSHTEAFERRREWERALGRARWSCVGWPAQYGDARNSSFLSAWISAVYIAELSKL